MAGAGPVLATQQDLVLQFHHLVLHTLDHFGELPPQSIAGLTRDLNALPAISLNLEKYQYHAMTAASRYSAGFAFKILLMMKAPLFKQIDFLNGVISYERQQSLAYDQHNLFTIDQQSRQIFEQYTELERLRETNFEYMTANQKLADENIALKAARAPQPSSAAASIPASERTRAPLLMNPRSQVHPMIGLDFEPCAGYSPTYLKQTHFTFGRP